MGLELTLTLSYQTLTAYVGLKHTLAAYEHSSTTFMELEQISTAFMEETGSLKEGCWPKNLVLRWWRQVAAAKDALNKDEDE